MAKDGMIVLSERLFDKAMGMDGPLKFSWMFNEDMCLLAMENDVYHFLDFRWNMSLDNFVVFEHADVQ